MGVGVYVSVCVGVKCGGVFVCMGCVGVFVCVPMPLRRDGLSISLLVCGGVWVRVCVGVGGYVFVCLRRGASV